jgi:hypothetical protein
MRLQFTLSEAQADTHPDWETRELTLDVEGTVELVYDTLRDSSTSNVLASLDAAQGLWVAEQDGRAYSDIVIAEPTAPEKEVAELLEIAEQLNIAEDALDEHVHDLVSQDGSSVNNGGLRIQLEFLRSRLGFEQVRRMLEQEIGEPAEPSSGEEREDPPAGSDR